MSKKVKKPIPIYIGILHQDNVHVAVANKIVEMIMYCRKTKKYEPTILYSKITGADHNRNVIVKNFLKSNCKWLIMMDDDNPCLKNPLELIELNKDVISCPTLMFRGEETTTLAFNAYKRVGRNRWRTLTYKGEGLFEMDRTGAGCIIIKRKVLEKVKQPFASKLNPKTGERFLGEDIYFSDKAKKAGFRIWGHWNYVCSHFKTIDLLAIANLVATVQLAEREGKNTDDLVPGIKIKRYG